MRPRPSAAHRPSRAALFVTLALLLSAFPASVAPPRLAASAQAQIDALTAIRQAMTPVQRKIDTALYLALLHQRGDIRLAPLTDFRFVRPDDEGRIDVDIVLDGSDGLAVVVDALTTRGAPIASASAAYRAITARVVFDDLEPLAALPAVRRIRRHAVAVPQAISVSEGVTAHLAAQGRDGYGTAGAGVKVCVLSNGVDSLATVQSTGDLPANVQVLPGQAGIGAEGTAMLEVIHDIAPEATLAFATATTSAAQFAQNILDLAAAGCQVMVDDVTHTSESPFQDGPIAQAVNTVAAAGVLYFSAAGDEGNVADGTSSTWEGDYQPNGNVPALGGSVGPAHNFGDGGQSILVTDNADHVLLSWAEHADAAGGYATTDYDVYIMNGNLATVFDASTNTQDGAGGDDFPTELAGQTFIGERIVVTRFAGSVTNPMFRLQLGRGRLDSALATGGALYGHSAATGAIAVGAAPATPPGPYPGPFTSASPSATFTSDGPRRIILNPDGTEITPGNRTSTGGVVRQKPELTAAAGVSTSTPGFTTFNGTSAAAPHAAAIAALIKSAVPTATAADIRSLLIDSAIDIEAPGIDAATGAGIVMALPALAASGATPVATLYTGALVATPIVGDGDAAIEPNEVWDLSIPLVNNGAAGATAIAGTLTSTAPGIAVINATSSYTNLAPGASIGNTMPFRIRINAGACGGTPPLSLAVTYAGGSVANRTFDIPFRLGGPGTPAVYSYSGGPVPIPDGQNQTGNAPGAPALAPLTVTGPAGNVWDLDLRIDGGACTAAVGATTVGITHTFAEDLQLGLLAPDGTSVLLFNRAGGSGNNFCQTVLDDEAGTSVQSLVNTNAPFTGSYRPFQALSAFDGLASGGTWQLSAQDFLQIDNGEIRAWSLLITPALCDAPPLVDLPPTVAAPANQTTPHDQVLGPLSFTIGDDFLSPDMLIVSATSSNQTVVATGGLVVAGTGASRTLMVTPIANASGSTTITIGASDGVSTGTGMFVVTVVGPNQPPTISPIAAQAMPANGTLAPVAFTIGDDTTAPSALVVTAASSNTALVPPAGLALGGSGATRTIAATPLAGEDGLTTVTITVSDGQASASTSFVLTVATVPIVPPNAPRDLTASPSGATVQLAWSAPDGGATPARYLVESSRTPLGTTLPLAVVDAAQRTLDVPLSPATYFFRVRAQNDAGASSPSNEAIATVGQAGTPGPPTALRAAIAGSQVVLAWQRPGTRPDPSEYRIEVGSGAGLSNVAVFDTGSSATTIAAPVPDGDYVARVRAKAGASVGAPSNEIAFRIGAAPCAAPPSPPLLLSPSVATDLITLGWLAPATGAATSYRLSAGTTPGSADVLTFDTGSSATALATGTPPPGTYYVSMQAENSCGLSATSNVVVVAVPAPVAPPMAPHSLTAATAGRAVTLWWLPPTAGALPTHYLVEAGSAPGLADYGVFPFAFSPGLRSVTFEGVPPGSFFVRVRAISAGGAGPASNEIIVVVP